MKDIPIIFSAPMVLALLESRKTMTRRLAWKHEPEYHNGNLAILGSPSPWQRVQPGDRLWVRENFATPFKRTPTNPGAIYRADGPEYLSPAAADHQWGAGEKWTPSIHMPRWASRLTLIVTATKIERLQEITEADALAEGIDDLWLVQHHVPPPRVASFKYLWNDLHGADTWDANPEVVALTFTVHKQNIDTLPKAEAA